jgi:energy-converting hydrogenase Eha subunit H
LYAPTGRYITVIHLPSLARLSHYLDHLTSATVALDISVDY